MRILFLTFRDPLNPYNGGGDIYLNELALGCVKHGHSVTLLSSKFNGCKTEEYFQGLRIIRLGSGVTLFLTILFYYLTKLRGSFDVVIEEVMGGPRVPFFAALYVREKIVGILQQRHKDIFRQQFSSPVAFLLSSLERFLVLLYRNKPLIVNSFRTQEDLRAIGYSVTSVHVIYPGLPESFGCQKNPDFAKRQDSFVCLTKLRRYKCIDDAIIAMNTVLKCYPECKLVVAGKTNDVEPGYEVELRSLVTSLGISNNVRFEKNISEKRKMELLSSSRGLILPSAIEGFGIVVIEANKCGTPVIASDRVPIAINNINSITYPLGDIQCLSKAMINLLSDESMWSRLSEQSVVLSKRFTWQATVNQFISLIKETVYGTA